MIKAGFTCNAFTEGFELKSGKWCFADSFSRVECGSLHPQVHMCCHAHLCQHKATSRFPRARTLKLN